MNIPSRHNCPLIIGFFLHNLYLWFGFFTHDKSTSKIRRGEPLLDSLGFIILPTLNTNTLEMATGFFLLLGKTQR
jgi:hypothetical protein